MSSISRMVGSALSYTAADGLGKGHVARSSARSRWGAVGRNQRADLSRIKNGRIATLTTSNGLPCDTIHWTTEDDDRSLWLYAACGLVRITRRELDAWVADPKRRIETTVWDEADGAMLQRAAPSSFGPTFAKSADGRLWYVTREGVQIVDPHHLASNKLPPPVHIEKVVADHKTYWQNLPGSAAVSNLRLPLGPEISRSTIPLSALSRRTRCISNTDWRARIRTGERS